MLAGGIYILLLGSFVAYGKKPRKARLLDQMRPSSTMHPSRRCMVRSAMVA
jgi:hypothetical protein